MTKQWQLSGNAESVDWSDLAMAGRAYADNLVGEPAVSKVMHMMADEIERLRSENASHRRISGEFLRRPYCGQNCADAKNDAIGLQSPAKTGTNDPRNGALVMAWGVFSDGECYSAFDAEEDATERADRLTTADPEREFNVIPLYAECRHCFADATPPPHATPPQGSVPGEGSFRVSQNANEPMAWWLRGTEYDTGCEYEYVSLVRESANAAAKEGGTVTPLYRAPTLTDEEREAVKLAADFLEDEFYGCSDKGAAAVVTLRKLLERLK